MGVSGHSASSKRVCLRVSVNDAIVGPKSLCVFVDVSGAWEWDHLQEALEEKLKNTLAAAQLIERIRSLIGKEKVRNSMFKITSPTLTFTTKHILKHTQH